MASSAAGRTATPNSPPSDRTGRNLRAVLTRPRLWPHLAGFAVVIVARRLRRPTRWARAERLRTVASGVIERPKVHVVVVTYCNRTTVDRCLASVRSSRGELAVTVVDNASPDGTGDHVARRYPSVMLIRNRLNVGFAAAVNQGARHGNGDYLLLVNPDTDLDELAIDQLLTLADRFPQAGLYGGRAVDEADELDPTTCLGRPTLWHAVAFGTGLAADLWIRLDPDSHGGWRHDDVRAVPVLTATFLLVDTQLWRRLGGFDERFMLHGEDVDLCVRATGLGATPMFNPLARHRRRGGASSTPEGRSIRSAFPGPSAGSPGSHL